MSNFPDSSGVSEKERIGKIANFSKSRYIYPKVSFWHFNGPPSIDTAFLTGGLWFDSIKDNINLIY